MTDFLVFRVYAPLSSWGDITVGETRSSWDRPSRSAVLGLLAAGLGLDREDVEGHNALERGYGIAVQTITAGFPLTDFHTTQTGNLRLLRKRAPDTRREYLKMEPRATTMSRRSYRQDAVSVIAVWGRGDSRWSLSELTLALSNPHFVLYAGRKANVLGAPLAPKAFSAATLSDALQSYRGAIAAVAMPAGWMADNGGVVEHDPCDGFDSGLSAVSQVRRRDVVMSRSRWQFSERIVMRGLPNRESGSADADEVPQT